MNRYKIATKCDEQRSLPYRIWLVYLFGNPILDPMKDGEMSLVILEGYG